MMLFPILFVALGLLSCVFGIWTLLARKTLSDKIAVLEKEEKALKEKVVMADEILLAIPLYDLGELRRQRQRLEK